MSHECFAYAKMLDREEVCDAGTRLLLLVVAEHTRNKTGRCYEDRAQLAHDCRCSTKTIQRKLKEMAGASPPIVKLYPRYRSDGSRRSDEIEIVGFRAWLKRNDPSTPEPDPSDPEGEAPDGADEAPGNEPSEEGSGPLENPPSADTPPGQSVQAPPLDNLSRPPPGQSVHTPGHLLSIPLDNRCPLIRKGPPLPERDTHTTTVESEDRGRVCVKFGKAIEQIWLERPELQHVLELFVGPLWAAKQKPKGIESPAAFLREIRDGLGEADFEIAVLERAQKIAATRRTVMPALPECLAYCRQAADELVAERKVYEETRKTDLRRQADPGMAAHTDALRERLRNRLGRDVFESWFAGLECEAVAGAVLMASVPEKFVKTWIDGHYAEELRECAAAQFPGLGKVEIKSRAANARAA